MFCTNCGNKLPEGSKFCPNCGARVVIPGEAPAPAPFPVPEQTAAEFAEEAAETAADAVEAAEETVEETFDAAQEAAEDFAEEAAETAEEVLDTASETAEAAQEAVGDFAEEAAESARQTVEAAQELAEETAETAADAVEAAEETVEETVETAQETAEDIAEEVTETAEEALDAAEETAEAAEEAVGEVTETAGEVLEGAAAAAAEAAVFTEPVFRTAEEAAPAPEALPADSAPETVTAPAAETSPYTMPAAAAAPPAKKKGKGLKAFIAVLLLAALAVGGYFLYQNLPAQKFKRYKQEAMIALRADDYREATAQFRNALDIEPTDEECLTALLTMHNNSRTRAGEALGAGDYEKAIEQVKLAYEIFPESSNDEEADLASIYYDWCTKLAYSGKEDEADSIFARAKQDGLSNESIEQISSAIEIGKGIYRTETYYEGKSAEILPYNEQKDYAKMFGILKEEVGTLTQYLETYGGTFPLIYPSADGSSAVIWMYDSGRKAAQIYIGDVRDNVPNGNGDTYYYLISSDSCEFFSAEWRHGLPNGEFKEINFKDAPGEPTDQNCDIVSGNCADGKYDGEILNHRSGRDYHMQFVIGKVQLLDTIDPNGDEKNVVAYTEDKSAWISMTDEALNGSYGLRYLVMSN